MGDNRIGMIELMTGHGGYTRPTENLPTTMRTAIEEHLEKRRKVPGRRRSAT